MLEIIRKLAIIFDKNTIEAMNQTQCIFLLCCLIGIWSCQSGDGGDDGADTTLSTVNTTIGYGYQTSLPLFMERVEFEIIGDEIRGQGARVEQNTQKTYRLTIEGKRSGNEAEVTVYATNSRQENDKINHREQWVFGDKQLRIKGRNARSMVGDYTLYRVSCGLYPNADTTLYDFHGSYTEGYAVVGRGGNYGLVNKAGEEVLPLEYKDLGIPSEGMLVFFDVETSMRGIINLEGDVLLPAKYGEITRFSEGLAAFLDDEKGLWGFMNTGLEIVIEPKYYGVNFFPSDVYRDVFTEGLAKVQLENNLWSFINTKGEMVIAGDFIYADPFVDGEARVFKDNKWYYINKAGECVRNCDEE